MRAEPDVSVIVPRRVSTVVLTGAGFSKDAGLPLTKELVPRGREVLKTRLGMEFVNALDKRALEVLEERVGEDIEALLTRLKVLEFYSAKYSTRVPGSPEAQNYRTKLLQLEMGIYILVWAALRLSSALPQLRLYDEFIRLLGNDVAFATLNYDLLLEALFQRNRRGWYYPLQGESNIDRNELLTYESFYTTDKSFYTALDEDPQSTPYLKLHGSFNWYYCWKCKRFEIVRDPDIGLHCTLLREGRAVLSQISILGVKSENRPSEIQ